MNRQLSLIPRGPRALGPLERSLGVTLRQWQDREHLTGPEHAGQRAILRELARLADAAIQAVARDERSEFSAASVVRMFRDTLDEYAPPPLATIDPRDQQLSDAALSILRAVDDVPF